MNATFLLDQCEQATEAADAVPGLRQFVLDLAVRGRLLKQDPSDEPASELLRSLQEGKDRLVREGVIKSPRENAAANAVQPPFAIPESWSWCRLSEVGAVVGGGTPSSGNPAYFTEGGSGIAWLSPADLGKHEGTRVSHGARDLTLDGLKNSSATVMPEGTVVFTSRAPIGYTAIAANPISTNQGFKSVVPFNPGCSGYISIFFRAFARSIDAAAPGTTFREVSGKIVGNLWFPLPPMAEQARIVAEVDELLALCDRWGLVRAKREAIQQEFVASVLYHAAPPLGDSEATASQALARNASLMLSELPRLTARSANIATLRRAVLTLAMRGELTEWCPGYEPSRIALERVGAAPAEAPAALPEGWCWATVRDVCDARLGKMLDKAKNKGVMRPYLRNVNVRWFDFDLSDLKHMRFEESELPEFELRSGDVLVCEGGEPGRAGVWNCRMEGVYFQKAVHRMRFEDLVNPKFFVYFLRESAWTGRLATFFTGTGIQHLTGRGLGSVTFPLPPRGEQDRIVATLDQVMSMCDELEHALRSSDVDRSSMLNALLNRALVGGDQP